MQMQLPAWSVHGVNDGAVAVVGLFFCVCLQLIDFDEFMQWLHCVVNELYCNKSDKNSDALFKVIYSSVAHIYKELTFKSSDAGFRKKCKNQWRISSLYFKSSLHSNSPNDSTAQFFTTSSEYWKTTQIVYSHCSHLYRESVCIRTVSCHFIDVVSLRFVLSGKTMASVMGLPVRGSRLKIGQFRQLTRNFNTNQTINRKLNSGQNYWWYLLGGSVCAGAYLKWQQTTTVTAFNPKKFKVSGHKVIYF